MPPIKVEGSPIKHPSSITVPAEVIEDEVKPEPAITIADKHVKTQDELAAESIIQQNVANKRVMTPHTRTETERVEQAKAAIQARWSRRFDWEDADLDDALSYLAELRAEVEKGGVTLQRRVSDLKIERVKCYGCDNIINISEGRYAGMRTRNNYETGIPESEFACSAACYLKLCREFQHPTNRVQ